MSKFYGRQNTGRSRSSSKQQAASSKQRSHKNTPHICHGLHHADWTNTPRHKITAPKIVARKVEMTH